MTRIYFGKVLPLLIVVSYSRANVSMNVVVANYAGKWLMIVMNLNFHSKFSSKDDALPP